MSAPKLSAFVIAYNRAPILGTCLRALRFADELIVVDKSSTDGSRKIAEAIADRVVCVPWTPTVEETRTLALSLCRHEWVLFADDDECVNPGAEPHIRAAIAAREADAFQFPLRHYIIGRHDERAYYWPEHHIRLFRRGAVTFSRTVHAGLAWHTDRTRRFDPDDVCIHHLSHRDTAEWIEKTNRYTSRADRSGIEAGPEGFAAFAHQRIDHWVSRTACDDPGGYPAAAALLRAVYDMVDAVKSWETRTATDGDALFREVCERLDNGPNLNRPRLSLPGRD